MVFTCLLFLDLVTRSTGAPAPPTPRFEAQTLDANISIGYGLAIGDVDGDGKPDIIAAGRATKNLKIYWNKSGQ